MRTDGRTSHLARFSSEPHAGVNILTGGENKEIVINRFYGGDIIHMVYSGIDTKLMLPIFGGYVKISEYGSRIGELAVSISPYAVMTPLGIYLMNESKKRKSLPLAIAGSGMVTAHFGGIIGDWFHFGVKSMYEVTEFVGRTIGYENFNPKDSGLHTPLTVLGFYIGCGSVEKVSGLQAKPLLNFLISPTRGTPPTGNVGYRKPKARVLSH
ncbi:hypothetical protein HZB02_06335 [Candidatus Woesearchaeota archaeon]|nr:hypothetical protein [Candidatus Woesearchaeota archaeon]